ncbi:hypothetical protein K1T71_004743 [Dendrolimus kikuchii]|uniref:Uncharacterized protein n=1 Tax=Dendrolimus kikuchii TaxID=765133 RepID=A0ACC1D8F1_9NEOP|nr:hypothetical protein K1T71_004743 [Dendrolimus kikuchii]
MGINQSARATHFQRPVETASEPATDEEVSDDHHISISNKIVERLVEDATLAGGAAAAAAVTTTPRDDYKDKIFMEKLKCMDENHSERYGLTIEDLHAISTRIELRTANMISPEPVCAECKEKVIECYNSSMSPARIVNCWDTVGDFTKCVQDAAASRLRARTQKEARDLARRTRHMAHAREHALRDLGPPPPEDQSSGSEAL